MKAVLLIGGQGTRLRPLTLTTPKPLLPIQGQPFLAYQLDYLRRYGFKDVILCTSYRADDFHQALGTGERYGVNITFVHENSPLGTGGAIKNAEPFIEENAIIFNGDVLMDLPLNELIEFHHRKHSKATVALTPVENPSAFGVISTDAEGRIQYFVEKPSPSQVTTNMINAGIYIFEKEIFSKIPKDQVVSIERDTFPLLLNQKVPLYAKHLPGYWLDIGTLEKYEQAQKDVADGRYPHRPKVMSR